MTHSPAVPDTARIGRTALTVSDLDETVAFYRDVVGLTVQTHDDDAATLGVDGTPLLVLRRDAEAAPRDRDGAGLFHNAFLFPSRAALGAALDRVREHWRLSGASDHYVSEALYTSDPEGNGVELYWDKPREEWPRNDDGTADIGTIPLDIGEVAAASDGSASAPAGTTVGHVHLETTSLDAARDFYTETLGFGVQTELPSALFLAAGDYHHHLGLNVWNGRSKPVGGRGLAWFEVIVPDDETLATTRRRLAEAGAEVTDRGDAEDGFELADPDGITIRFRAD
ncbi:catechol 2,3-dioxygenase [Halogranum gelatinilyticum]|uniref:Catechol 2,3-dioxygenase n=1 Tax=Halogranum gelatinilyticum TaxID=660521 RepID=A0A1G9T9A2_9EURY|nr:VOC family protein [Halogranum gelatinilyticum]SDM44323.1 catechol 2,3-dioxygenase [Halogranum gelatinilyticum]